MNRKVGRPKNTEAWNSEKVREVVDILGSMSKLARALEVTESAVFNWCNGKYQPNHLNCLRMENLTEGKIKAEDIRPEVNWDNYRTSLNIG